MGTEGYRLALNAYIGYYKLESRVYYIDLRLINVSNKYTTTD